MKPLRSLRFNCMTLLELKTISQKWSMKFKKKKKPRMYKIHSKTNFLRATALEQHTKYSIHDLNDKLCFGFD